MTQLRLKQINTEGMADGEYLAEITSGVLTLTPHAGGAAGHVIEDEGSDMTARTHLDFQGAGVSLSDDAGNDRTVVTIPDAWVLPGGNVVAMHVQDNIAGYGPGDVFFGDLKVTGYPA